MIPEFIAFRYQGVRRIHEILAKPEDLGWKCRKYIKWREVHNSKTDAKALYAFGDELIEKGRLKLDLYGQISGVCLNVQKWRLDKEKMSVEPPSRKEWEERDILFKAAKTNPALISARLAEHGVSADGQSSLLLQILFYACELDTFFQSQGIQFYPLEPIPKTVLDCKSSELCQKLEARFDHVYRLLGISILKTKDASRLVQQVMVDIGFSEVTLNPNLFIPARVGSSVPDCLLEMVVLEKFKLIEVAIAGGITRVRLNANHPFIKSIAAGGNLSVEMEGFFKAYASCMLRMGGSLDTLETFNSYLGIDLQTANS